MMDPNVCPCQVGDPCPIHDEPTAAQQDAEAAIIARFEALKSEVAERDRASDRERVVSGDVVQPYPVGTRLLCDGSDDIWEVTGFEYVTTWDTWMLTLWCDGRRGLAHSDEVRALVISPADHDAAVAAARAEERNQTIEAVAKAVEDAHHCPPPDIVLASDGGIHCLSVTHDQWLKDLRAIAALRKPVGGA